MRAASIASLLPVALLACASPPEPAPAPPPRREPIEHEGELTFVCADPAGRRALVGTARGELVLWDLLAPERGDALARVPRPPGSARDRFATAAAFATDGRRFVVGWRDGEVERYALTPDGRALLEARWSPPEDERVRVSAVAFAREGGAVWAAISPGAALVLAGGGAEYAPPEVRAEDFGALALGDGETRITLEDGALCIYPAGGRRAFAERCEGLAVAGDGAALLGGARKLRRWHPGDPPSRAPELLGEAHDRRIRHVAARGAIVATADDREVRVGRLVDGELKRVSFDRDVQRELEDDGSFVRGIALAEGRLLIARSSGRLHVVGLQADAPAP